ncbi:MAG TPA: maleylpyruvate isomerase family mycothiol-dependent enzyme [Micromonosporaceae bacterium]|nr:maleylpyruvate isomerase family mycothiol-dependent enzyme [Micromonosporaceae bacterium]
MAAGSLDRAVPSCPEWTVADLVRHVAEVYLHKTEAMRRGEWPRPWPPDLSGEEPLDVLRRSYDALVGELTSRKPEEPSVTWFGPEQTVGFWIRRMAHETVIHRVDGELGAGAPLAPVPTDLALDGIDEVLVRFLAYGTREWAEDFGDQLASCDGRVVRVTSGGSTWLARLTPQGVDVTAGDGEADATVRGEPEAVLLWLWRRVGDERVGIDGDQQLVARLHELLGPATE